jgi:hypothetical protein
MTDVSWGQVIRPQYRENHAHVFGTGDYLDDGLAHMGPGGSVNMAIEEGLALQGTGENSLDIPVESRPGRWHNADHSFNETQFKHGYLPNEITPRPTDSQGAETLYVTNEEYGSVLDSYVFDVNPNEKAQVAGFLKNIASKAYNTDPKGDTPNDAEATSIPFHSNPFGGTRARIAAARAKVQASDTTSATAETEENVFSKAVAADNLGYFYEQPSMSPDGTDTPSGANAMAKNRELGLRRVSIRKNPGTLVARLAQREGFKSFDQTYKSVVQQQVDTKSVLAQAGMLSEEERQNAIKELRSYPGGQFTAVQSGLNFLSHKRQKETKKGRKDPGNINSHYL